MSNQLFWAPRMKGARFNEHTIPLDILKDLAALESMVLDVAKWHYLEENSDKQRTPNGFSSAVSLQLSTIEEGSAIPNIYLSTTPSLFPGSAESYFFKAKETIISVVRAVNQGLPFSHLMPPSFLSGFDKIGRSLKPSESIELAPSEPQAAILDQQVRHKLVLAASKTQKYTENITVRGCISRLHSDENTFTLQLINGRTTTGTYQPQHHDDILTALSGFKEVVQTKIKLQGIGTFNRFQRLQSMVVEHTSILPSRDVGARLDAFRTFKKGWFDGEGEPFEDASLDWLTEAFDNFYLEDLPLPLVFPLPDGTVRAEWRFNDYEASLEIDLRTKQAAWFWFSLSNDHDDEKNLNLMETSDWAYLNKKIKESMV